MTEATWIKARNLRPGFSYRVAAPRYCLIRLRNRSIRLRALHKYLSESRGCFRFALGGITVLSLLVSTVLTSGWLSYALYAITAEGE